MDFELENASEIPPEASQNDSPNPLKKHTEKRTKKYSKINLANIGTGSALIFSLGLARIC